MFFDEFSAGFLYRLVSYKEKRSKEYSNDTDKSNYGLKSKFGRAASTFTIQNSHLLQDNKLVIYRSLKAI